MIVAFNGGTPKRPSWYLSLPADRNVRVQVKAHKSTAHAGGRELWDQMAKVWPYYNEYTKKTDREIPTLVLERV
ncbi:nitroreductase/quinone reductase family protein [Amycolatopsis sp. DSM 110486]|uniref:nitroreductase/quinone reductase family protein n=1 Tax=Amycolatopsis sp. DSM 110486 TaxID=2865832 RepID=UPI001C6977EF|nr:nitroreductase/quinone reductase family protein [Amycolatopsis sp. DSM 110486]QYN19193.1 nitroreductase family deazaflavin-dependent oxidoreductase [Amycolatopsis sp. DSM 110486]